MQRLQERTRRKTTTPDRFQAHSTAQAWPPRLSRGASPAAAATSCAQQPAAAGQQPQLPRKQQPPASPSTLCVGVDRQQRVQHVQQQQHVAAAAARRTSPEAALSAQLRAAESFAELQLQLQAYAGGTRHDARAQQQQARPALQSQQQRQQQQQAAFLKKNSMPKELNLNELNGQHLARLLAALVRLQPPPAPARSGSHAATSRQAQDDAAAFWSFSMLVFSECLEQLPLLRPTELSRSLWAASKLAQPPPAPQLRQLLAQLAAPHVLATANAQDLSMALYAAASLALQVQEAQLDVLAGAAAGQLHAATPQSVSNTLWAVTMLGHRPPADWLRRVEAHCCGVLLRATSTSTTSSSSAVQQQQGGFTPVGMHQVFWAMAKLQWRPTDAFLEAFWAASLRQLQHMKPQATTGILWAVGSLALQPPQPWVDAWLQAIAVQLQQGACQAQDVSNALWSVARLGLSPGEPWLHAALQASYAVLPAAGTQELSNTLWALAKLGRHPPPPWMALWLQALYGRMGSYCAPALACSGYALALLRFRPPRPWMAGWFAETARQMPAFGAQELSNLVWACAVLGARPPPVWLRAFEVQALSEAGSFNAQELACVCWSLAKLQHGPPAGWVASVLREGLEVADGMQARNMVLLLKALVRWQLPEIREGGSFGMLLPRYWAAAHQLLPACDLGQLSFMLYSRIKLGCMPTAAWSASFWQAVQGSLQEAPAGAQQQPEQQQLDPAAVSRLIWAAGRLWQQAPPPAACLQQLLHAAVLVMPQCSYAALTAVGLGALGMTRGAAKEEEDSAAEALAEQLWPAWFERSTQLLLAEAAAAASQQQQQQQQRRRQPHHLAVSGSDIALQLRVVCGARVRPPPAWCAALLAALPHHLPGSDLEQLSWLLHDLVQLRALCGGGSPPEQQQQLVPLPPGIVGLCISRAAAAVQGGDDPAQQQQEGGGLAAAAASRALTDQMLRLAAALRRLRAGGATSDLTESEWARWQRLLAGWRAAHGV